MQFLLLGQLTVLDDRGASLDLGGLKQRAVLGALLVHPNEVVRKTELIDWLWASSPPASASHSVDVYVSRLRRLLGSDADRLASVAGGGYRLRVDRDDLDSARAELLLDRAADQEAIGDLPGAAAAIAEALELFRGPVLGDLSEFGFATPEVVRLEALQPLMMERQGELELACGGSADLVGRLEAQVAAYPDRERLWELLMLAHYHAQNQPAALATFDRARRYLTDEYGVDPGPALTELHRRILRQDDSLPARPPPASRDGTRPSEVRDDRRRRWRGPAAAVLVALLVVLTWARPTQSSNPGPVLQVLDISTGQTEALVPVGHVLGMEYADGLFWMLRGNNDGLALSFIAVAEDDGTVVREVASPYPDLGHFLPIADSLWVSDYQHPEIARIDIRTGLVAERIDLGGGPPPQFRGTSTGAEQFVFAAGDLCVGRTGEVVQVDLDSHTVVRRIPLPYEWGMVASATRVWVARQDGVSWIDPFTGREGKLAPIVRPQNLAVAGDGVWAADPYGSVYEVTADGQTRVRSSSEGLDRPVDLSRNASSVWESEGTQVVAATSLDGNQHREYRFEGPVQAFAVGTHRAAAVVPGTFTSASPSVTPGASPGQVLRMAWSRSTGDPLDPALSDPTSNPWLTQLHRLTCVQLFKSADGPTGPQIRPDLARTAAWISKDGLTYRFDVTKDRHFAPPVSRSITAEDVRFSIERAVAVQPRSASLGATLLADIDGISSFVQGKERHIAGITVDGDTLTIKLARPIPDLLGRLSLPTFCVVPQDSAAPNSALIPPVSAGPYYFISHKNGGATVLTRNPNVTGATGLTADTVIVDESISASQAVEGVRRGTVQHVSYDSSSFVPLRAAALTTGDEMTVAYHASRLMSVRYLAFNAGRKPFSDAHLRRVIVDSLDRPALVADEAAVPSRSLLPEGIFDSHTGSRASPSGSSGSDWHRPITLGYQRGCNTCALGATRIADQLVAMGFTVRQRTVDDVTESASTTSTLDLAVTRTQLAYPDPATFLETMLGVDVPKDWLADDIAQHIDRLRTLSGPARDREAIRLADSLSAYAPVAVYATETMGELTSGMTCPVLPGAGLDLIGCVMK